MWENAEQNNFEYEHFLRSDWFLQNKCFVQVNEKNS